MLKSPSIATILTHELGVPVKTFNKNSSGWYPGTRKLVKLKESGPLAGPNYIIKISVRGDLKALRI